MGEAMGVGLLVNVVHRGGVGESDEEEEECECLHLLLRLKIWFLPARSKKCDWQSVCGKAI